MEERPVHSQESCHSSLGFPAAQVQYLLNMTFHMATPPFQASCMSQSGILEHPGTPHPCIITFNLQILAPDRLGLGGEREGQSAWLGNAHESSSRFRRSLDYQSKAVNIKE